MADKRNPNTLRAVAEAQLSHAPATDSVVRSAEELLHELQVHRIELEMQNDELRRAHIILEESRDRYIDLYDFAPVGYLTLTREGLIAEINLTAAGLLGVDRCELLNRRFAAFVTPQDGDLWYLFFVGVLRYNKRQNIELTLKRNDGTEFPVQLNCKCVITDDRSSMLLITLTDITEIKKAEVAVREAEAITLACVECKQIEKVRKDALNRLQKIASQLPGMIFQFRLRADGSSCFPYASAAIRTIYRLGPKEVRKDASKVFALLHPDDYDGIIDGIQKSARDLSPWCCEYRVKFDDGTVCWLSGNARLQREADGSTLWHGFITDITERKYREQQDKEHLDQLAHVTRLGLMGEMASGIAHEVNQPLGAISNYTQASLNLINAGNPDLIKLTDILSKTHHQASRAGQIIYRMREFVKSHAKQRSTTDVNTLIHGCVDLCVAELKQNSIELTFELENNLPSIHVDEIQIEQVIINLIKNSVDALRDLPAKQQRHIAIHSQLTLNNDMQVRVKDNGSGLDKNQQQKVLTPFYTTKADGMGMGLSISRSLIEAHGGTLYVNSEPGKGTTFYFNLPIQRKKR